METEGQGQGSFGKPKQKRTKVIVKVLLFVLLLIVVGPGAYSLYKKRGWLESRLDLATYWGQNDSVYSESLRNGNPKPLQEAFVADIENGVNDAFTKLDAYFLTHRYFDNGGNIYEIYDYVNSHSSLAFLKEAEDIYPTIFDQIQNKTLSPEPYSTSSLFAMLAYLEVLDNHGYANFAALATLANQYAKTAYFIKMRAENIPPSTNNTPDSVFAIRQTAEKAIFYELKAKDMLNGMSKDGRTLVGVIATRPESIDTKRLAQLVILPDLLVGLNQYAAALRYLEVAGTDIAIINSPVSAQDIFHFSMVLAKQGVPELELFTSLLNASTLSLVSSDTVAIQTALQPMLDFDVTKPEGIVLTLLKAKDRKRVDLDVYGKINLVNLARIVPEFKTWLIRGGWTEANFQ